MSSYFSEEDQPEEIEKTLFLHESSISKNSSSILNEWKENLKLEGVDYLHHESALINKQYNFILSINQIRLISFCHTIKAQLERMVSSYSSLYKNQTSGLGIKLAENDQRVRKLVYFYHACEPSTGYYDQLYENKTSEIFQNLRQIITYAIDRETIWQILNAFDAYDESQHYQTLSTSFSSNDIYYQKEIKHILRGKPELSQYFQPSSIFDQVLKNLTSIINNDTINNNLKLKYTTLIKGQYYGKIKSNELKQIFIKKSLQMYYCVRNSQMWNEQEYEEICLMVMKEAMKDPQYRYHFLFIQLDGIRFHRRKKIKQFLQYFNQIFANILNLEQKKLKGNLISNQFMEYILQDFNLASFLSILVNFYQEIKNIYSQKDRQLHQLFIEGIEKLKKIYLSFAGDVWVAPSSFFTVVGNGFFSKHLDSLNEEVIKLLPKMIEKMCSNRMPTLHKILNNEVVEQKICKLQYLQIFFYYITDCKTDDYLYFQEFVPIDQETAILFVKVLQLRYNYHEPNQEEKKNYTIILDQCTKHYKINPKFEWYKPSIQFDDRDVEFTLHRQVAQPWARKIIQDALNFKDVKKNDLLTGMYNRGQIKLVNVVDAFKYSLGFNLVPGRYSINETDLIPVMQEMSIILCMHFQNVFQLCLEDQISVNSLHLYLLLYNTKINENSQLFPLIVNKIIRPWFKTNSKRSKEFKDTYFQFFRHFLIAPYILSLGDTLFDYIMENQANSNEESGIIEKLNFFKGVCEDNLATSTENAIDFLTRLISIFHPNLNCSIFLSLIELFIIFINRIADLKEIFSLQSIIDTELILNKERFQLMMKKLKDHDLDMANNVLRCIYSTIPNIKNKNQIPLESWGNLIKTSMENDLELNYIYESILKIKEIPQNLLIVKAIVCYAYSKENKLQKGGQLREIFQHLVKMVEEVKIDKNASFSQIFGFKILQHLKADCRTQKQDMIETKIWKNAMWKIGNMDDISEFGDTQTLLLQTKQKQKQFLISLILSKDYKNQILHKGTSKLPIIRDCALEVVKILLEEQHKIRPQHICKLIMINNKFSSVQVERFILNSIPKFYGLIPIKIYQKYLVNDIKKQLGDLKTQEIREYFYLKSYQSCQKINSIFKKIICLPLSNFDSINLTQMENIEENNDEWQTQSEKDEEEQKRQKKASIKKKQSIEKQQSLVQGIVDESVPSQSETKFIQEEIVDESVPSQSEPKFNQNIEKFMVEPQIQDSSLEDVINDESFDDDDDDIDIDDYDSQRPTITQLFVEEGYEANLAKYKDYIRIREQVNVIVGNNYSQPLTKYKSEEFDGKILQLIKIIQSITNDEIIKSMLCKMPPLLFDQLKRLGITKEQDRSDQQNIREEEEAKPRFGDMDYDSQNQQEDDYSLDDESESYRLEQSEDDMWEQQNSQQKIKQYQCEQEIEEINLPDLKNITSHIEEEITGNEFTKEQVTKILEIALFQLFLLSSGQGKLKAIVGFYSQVLKSKLRKIFVDSLLVMARIEQTYKQQHYYSPMNLSPRRALDSILYFISKCYEDENDKFYKELANEGGALLPTSTQIQNQIPVQDNILTLLIFYSKIKHPKTYRKLFQILRITNKTNYQLNNKNGKLLTNQVFKNENESGIWKKIEYDFNIKMDKATKFYCCLSVYGQKLKEELFQTLKIEDKIESAYKVKVAQNQLKSHQKKLKHFYYWNKSIISSLQPEDKKKGKVTKLLKNSELISLVELMFFYLKKLKDDFFQKISDKIFNKMIWFPKSVIQISFMYIKSLSEGIKKWETKEQVSKFYTNFNYGSYNFKSLENVCNLIIEFLQVPSFSVATFKDIIIPYYMKNPEGAVSIPLVFKAPNIPEDVDGQRLYVTRDCSFDMSFYQLNSNSILVEYHDQEGSDHGGMVRQLMMGWQGEGIGEQYCFIGQLLGISFKKGIPYGGQLDLSMAITITNYTPTLKFIQEVDPKLYGNLKFIVENDVEDLDLYFVISKQKYGRLNQYPLKQNGQKIQVTNDNKKQYIDLYLKEYYRCGKEWELNELKVGFYSIVNKKYASIFHPLELMQKVRGQEVNDYMKLKKKAKYEEGYTEATPIIKWLWQIISQFDQLQMNKFIQFLTGAPKISLYDPHFKFVIEKTYGEEEKNKLPVAHTCFNTLDLPEYASKQILQKKLKQAIFEGNDNFGIL